MAKTIRMRLMITFILLLTIVLSASLEGAAERKKNYNGGGKMEIKSAIEAAMHKADEMRYPVEAMEVVADETNAEWEKFINAGPFWEFNRELQNKLEGKKYWAIYFRSKKLQLGGDLWVFVDKEDRSIITTLKGE